MPPNPYGDKTTSQIIAEIESRAAGIPPVSDPKSEPSSPPTPEKTSAVQEDTVGPRPSAAAGNEGAPNSKLKPQNSTSPKPPLSDYERALREGKTFLEALYIHSARPKSANADLPGRSPAQRNEARPTGSRPPGASAWDSFSQPVLPSPYASLASLNLRFG